MKHTNINRVAGYRAMLNMTQEDMGKIIGIKKQQYSLKERKKYPFSDKEKQLIKNYLMEYFPNITIDDIFFN